MWDHQQKTGGGATLDGGSEINKQDTKFESSEQDSGFLSGPQNFYSSSELNSSSASIGDRKYIDSGAIDVDNDDDDDNHTNSHSTKDNNKQQEDQMILDSGVDLGLEEWFCGLNIKNSPQSINNLGKNCKKAAIEEQQQQSSQKLTKQLEQLPLWQICYYQDEEGDT